MSGMAELPGGAAADDTTLANTSCTATINAPIEKIDIPSWCFSLPDSEYQACSPAHYAAGTTTAPDGRRMSVNVEVIGGSLSVQHFVEDIAEPSHLRLVSHSDLFTPSGRTKIDVIWELSATKIDDDSCEFTNTVHSSAPPEILDFLAKQGLSFDAFRTRTPTQLRSSQPPGDAAVRQEHRASRPGPEVDRKIP